MGWYLIYPPWKPSWISLMFIFSLPLKKYPTHSHWRHFYFLSLSLFFFSMLPWYISLFLSPALQSFNSAEKLHFILGWAPFLFTIIIIFFFLEEGPFLRIFKYFFFFQGGVLLFLLSIFFLKGCLLGLILRHCLSFLSSFFVGKGGSSAIFVFFVREVFFSFLGGYHLLDFFYHFLFIFFIF